jgi:hypothetical protein
VKRTVLIGIAMAVAAFADPETIVITCLPDAVINKNYSVQLTAAPGQAPAWTLAQDALPPGLTLSATGVISGTPNTLGASSFLIRATDPQYGVAYQALTLDVTLGPLNISNVSLPIATQGAGYSVTLAGAGGVPPYKWSFASTVTEGMAIDPASGTLSGTPSAAGSYAIPIQVTDSLGKTFSRAYSFFVAAPLSVLTTALPNGAAGVAYSQTLTAGGGQAPYTWSASGLPMGLQINPATGVIGGIPAANGTYTVNFGLTDYSLRNAARTILLTTGPGVVVTNTSLAMGTIGMPYSQTLIATGGQAPYTWQMGAGGSLPPGLSLSAAGVISGTPLYGSSLTFSVKATDSLGLVAFATYTINILPQLEIITTSLPPIPVGTVYLQAITATGGETPYRWSAANLPAGLSLNAATGMIVGTPSSAGSTTVAVTVTDALNHSATQALEVTTAVAPVPAVTIGGLPLSTGYLQQPSITVSLASPYTATLTGTLTVSFLSSLGTDPMIAFVVGGQSVTSTAFTIPAGATQAQFSGSSSVTLMTGTVAGTITLTVTSLTAGGTNVTPSPAPSATLTNNPTVPFISTISFSQTPGGVTVVVNGFSSTRDMMSGLFTFAPSSNATIATNNLTVSLSSAFSTWYSSSTSNQYGSEFTLTVPFGVANGAAGDLVSVTVTLTNSKGNSNAVSPTQ